MEDYAQLQQQRLFEKDQRASHFKMGWEDHQRPGTSVTTSNRGVGMKQRSMQVLHSEYQMAAGDKAGNTMKTVPSLNKMHHSKTLTMDNGQISATMQQKNSLNLLGLA